MVDKDDEDEGVYQTSTPESHVDDSQCVTLKLVDNDTFLQFQVDTGEQCNVVPLDLYKKNQK